MSDVDPANIIHTRIWQEEAEPGNAFATRAAYCRGYDVFGEMVGNARWVEMLFLLFRNELPDPDALDMLEALAVALANPGPRDPSIHAAMASGVCGSPAAASLIAALSVGAGQYGGARDVFDAVGMWTSHGNDLAAWAACGTSSSAKPIGIWPGRESPPGFDPHAISTSTVVRQLLGALVRMGATPSLAWLAEHREELEAAAGMPLAVSGVAAAALFDLGFSPKEGEMIYLLLRLPGAAAHALEQGEHGYKRFPFYPLELEDDPAQKESA
ncbi:MAG: citryl-CoA lyase [Noviherbaspirillum sp.]